MGDEARGGRRKSRRIRWAEVYRELKKRENGEITDIQELIRTATGRGQLSRSDNDQVTHLVKSLLIPIPGSTNKYRVDKVNLGHELLKLEEDLRGAKPPTGAGPAATPPAPASPTPSAAGAAPADPLDTVTVTHIFIVSVKEARALVAVCPDGRLLEENPLGTQQKLSYGFFETLQQFGLATSHGKSRACRVIFDVHKFDTVQFTVTELLRIRQKERWKEIPHEHLQQRAPGAWLADVKRQLSNLAHPELPPVPPEPPPPPPPPAPTLDAEGIKTVIEVMEKQLQAQEKTLADKEKAAEPYIKEVDVARFERDRLKKGLDAIREVKLA